MRDRCLPYSGGAVLFRPGSGAPEGWDSSASSNLKLHAKLQKFGKFTKNPNCTFCRLDDSGSICTYRKSRPSGARCARTSRSRRPKSIRRGRARRRRAGGCAAEIREQRQRLLQRLTARAHRSDSPPAHNSRSEFGHAPRRPCRAIEDSATALR